MSRAIRSQARLAALLTRHLLHVMRASGRGPRCSGRRWRWRSAIGVGLLAFTTSIEDSFRERGEAVGGVSDVQVEAVGASSLPPACAERLERIDGHALRGPDGPAAGHPAKPAGEQVVATAIGVDRSARRLRSAVQRDLGCRASALGAARAWR